MKRLLRNSLGIFLLSGILAIVAGCEQILSYIPEVALVEAEIGPLGGTISYEGIALTIPPDCFSDTEMIKILLSEEETPYDELSHTANFAIQGLPSIYSKSIMVKLAYTTEPTEYPYIVLSTDYFGMDMEEGGLSYFSMEAIDSLGYLTISLPASDPDLTMTKPTKVGNEDLLVPEKIFVQGVFMKKKFVYSAKKNFKLIWPYAGENPDNLVNALVALEDALSYFTSDPEYDISRRTKWPVEVNISRANPKDKAWFSPSFLGVNYGSLGIHPDFLSMRDSVTVRSTMFHELFHLIHSFNLPNPMIRHRYNVVLDPYHSFEWFTEASALWANTLIPEASDLAWTKNPAASFNGFHAGSKGSLIHSRHHGYGMGAVIVYLIDKYDPRILWETWNDIRAGTDPLRALLFNVDHPNTWLPDYYETFLTKYHQRYPELFFREHETFTIKKGAEKQTNTFEYPAMSGRYFDINLNHDLSASSSLSINLLDGDPINDHITVLKHKDLRGFEKVVSGGLSVGIPNLKEIINEGKDLVAIVSHSTALSPYEDSAPITMEIKLEEREFAYIKLESALLGFFDGFWGEEEVKDFEQGITGNTPVFISEDIYEHYPTIEKSGNTYLQSWDFTVESAGDMLHYKGSLSVTFDDEQKRIISFDLVLDNSYSSWRGIRTNKSRIASTSCSIKKENNYTGLDWELWGPSLCPALTTVEQESTNEEGRSFTLQRHECPEKSYVAFEFVR